MMKKTKRIVVFLSLLSLCLLPIASLHAGGAFHIVWGNLFNSDGSIPADEDIDYTTFITVRPSDTITCGNNGAVYESGYWQGW